MDLLTFTEPLSVVENWRQVLSKRSANNLGAFGPCVFRKTQLFFEHVLAPQTVEHHHKVTQALGPFVVIGDLYGSIESLLSSLEVSGVIDKQGQWIGEETHVVILGDSGKSLQNKTSSNPHEASDILQYIFALNVTAKTTQGSVVCTLARKPLHHNNRLAQYLQIYHPFAVKTQNFVLMRGGFDIFSPDSETLHGLETIGIHWDSFRPSKSGRSSTAKIFKLFGIDWETGGIIVASALLNNGIKLECAGKIWVIDKPTASISFDADLYHPTYLETRVSTVAEKVTKTEVNEYENGTHTSTSKSIFIHSP